MVFPFSPDSRQPERQSSLRPTTGRSKAHPGPRRGKRSAAPLLRYLALALLALFTLVLGSIPLKLAASLALAPQPQAMLVLGGNPARESFTAYFAQGHLDLPIWLSSGQVPGEAIPSFQATGIPLENLHFDRRAVDTVTNFTTLLPEFRQRDIRHLFLITSDYHIARATAIAALVLGSRGIATTPISVPSGRSPEPRIKILRDAVRSLCWIFTGWTGAGLQAESV